MKSLARRTQNVANVGAFAVWQKANQLAAQGADIIRLEIGEPERPTPTHISQAGIAAIKAGRTRYGPSQGTTALREAIANDLQQTHAVAIDPAQVVVTPGNKAAIFFGMLALVEPGDEVLIPSMGFPAYEQIAQIAGGRVVRYALRRERNFEPDVAEIAQRITPNTKCLILNSPANPSGTIQSAATLQAIANLAIEHDLWVLTDEIYRQIYFTPQPPPSIYSLPRMPERTVLLNGFSKSYAMTGWRLGYGVFPHTLAQTIAALTVNAHSNVPLFVQDAGLAALTGSQDSVVAMRQQFLERRNLVVAGLKKIPQVKAFVPDGAFYVLFDVSKIGDGRSVTFANRALEHGVSLLPADGFGPGGQGFIRLSLTRSDEQLGKAIERIAATARQISQNKQG